MMRKLHFELMMVLVMLLLSCKNETSTSNLDLAKVKETAIDVSHQIIELTADWDKKQLAGKTTLSFLPKESTKIVTLDAAKLDVESVWYDKNEIDFQIDDGNENIILYFPNLITPNEVVELEIHYETSYQNQSDPRNIWGSFGNGPRYFEPTMTDKERRKQLWVFGEPESNKYFFPSNHKPEDIRTSELIVEVTKPIQVISNGELISQQNVTNNEVRFHWKCDTPHSPHHIFMVVGEYDNFQQRYNDVIINNYGYPDEKDGTKESVVRLPDMMKFFSEYTLQEYPYNLYSQIFIQDFAGWKPGLGNSLVTENMIDDKTTHEDFLYGWDLTEGEALAAQWFGSYIKPKSWEDTWLTKGFSRYFSGLYNQYKNGNTEFLTYQLSPDLGAYLNDWNSGKPTIVVPDSISNIEAFVNSTAPYAKGAIALHMLRKELGEEKWQMVIQSYVSRFGNKLVETNDFIDVVNEVSGRSMNWFFKQWIYGIGHPIFRVERRFNREKKELTLDVYQEQKVDSTINGRRIPFFKGKMFIELDDKVEAIELEPVYKNTFVFSANSAADLMNFDFEDTWIKEQLPVPKETDKLLIELQTSKDVLHRVATMQRLTTKALSDTTDTKTKSKIKEALLNRAVNESYWRMRLTAISQLGQLFNSSSGFKIVLDKETEKVLLQLVEREASWMKAWTINFLGNTRDKKYVPIYLEGLMDYSDRVVFMSAIALGKSKDSRAFKALMSLPQKPSWKNQSLISALYGLKELKDPRGYDLAITSLVNSNKPHWNLVTPIWDHRLAAAYTLKALDETKEGSELVFKNFKDAFTNGNINDIFYNAQTLGILGGEFWLKAIEILEKEYENDNNAIEALKKLENQFPLD